MNRPLLIDLFCGAGGAARGYAEAGFDILGVDIEPMPNYPYPFIRADALTFDLRGVDAIHASPPCQAYSWAAKRWGKEWPDLLTRTRERLQRRGLPYVLENVIGAPIGKRANPPQRQIVLCAWTMATLAGVPKDFRNRSYTFKHRVIETSFPLAQPPHREHPRELAIKRLRSKSPFVTVAGHGGHGSAAHARWCEAMGIDWMTQHELAEAIPPSYTAYIGAELIRWVERPSCINHGRGCDCLADVGTALDGELAQCRPDVSELGSRRVQRGA